MTWQTEHPLRPPPGIDLIDKICISADQRERRQAQAPDVMQQMMTVMTKQTQMQSQILQALVALVARMEGQKQPEAKKK
jgi:hypothetical protein